MESSVSQLMLMWRQIKAASGDSTGFTLAEVEALDKLRKKVGIIKETKHGTRSKRNP